MLSGANQTELAWCRDLDWWVCCADDGGDEGDGSNDIEDDGEWWWTMVNDFLNLPKKVADGAGFEPV